LRYAVLDRDQSSISERYKLDIAGSRYFIEQSPITDYGDVDQRLKSGDIALAIEIPPGFGRNLLAGRPVAVGAWFDGSMPQRAETVQGYIQGLHQHWMADQMRMAGRSTTRSAISVENRFRYNPEVESPPAMVPSVIPLLLLMLPAMLTALAVVREKERGSIINLYVTPVTRSEFLLGKQIPYVALAMINFVVMLLMAVFLFDVPPTGDVLTLTVAVLIFSVISTGMGLLASAITRSQIAALFLAMVGTMIPAVTYGGMTDPVSSLEGSGRIIGTIYPASHMFTISRGVFSKALGFSDLMNSFWPLMVAALVIIGLAIAFLRKQER
jgi:ribosome-dependent ATPase